MAELQINIKTQAELDALGKATKEIGGSITALKAQAAAIVESDKQAKVLDTTTKKLTTSKADLKGAIKGLAFEFPLLGRAISLVTNPVALLVGAISAAVAAVKNYIDTQRELAQAQAVTQQAIEDQVGGLERYEKATKAAGKEVDILNGKLELEKNAQDKVAQELLKLEKLRVQGRVARGEITDAEGIRLTGQLEGQAEGQASARAIAFLKRKITNLENAAAAPLRDGPDAQARLDREEARQKALANASGQEFSKTSERLTKEIEEIQSEEAAFVTSGELSPQRVAKNIARGIGPRQAAGQFQKEIREREAELATAGALNNDRQRSSLTASDRAQFGRDSAARRASAAGQLPGLFNELSSLQQSSSQIAPIQAQQHSQTASNAAAEELAKLRRESEKLNTDLIKAFLSTSQAATEGQKQLLEAIEELKRKQAQLESRQRNLRN